MFCSNFNYYIESKNKKKRVDIEMVDLRMKIHPMNSGNNTLTDMKDMTLQDKIEMNIGSDNLKKTDYLR